MESYTAPLDEPRPSGQVAGWLLAASSLLSLLFMLHHPSVAATATGQMVAEVSREALLAMTVHGVLIAMLFVQFYSLTVLSVRLGLRRGPVIAGLTAQAAGVLAMLGAALISGFLVPDLAGHLGGASREALEMGRQQMSFAHLANQRLAQVGVVAMGLAMAMWSITLLADRGFTRLIGAAGLLLGSALVTAMLSGRITLHVHGMTLVLAILVVWYLAVAVQLIRRAM